MARPKKDYKVQRNGNSLQFYRMGEYCGSLPLMYLCEMARAKSSMDTVGVIPQSEPSQAEPEKEGSHTESKGSLDSSL